MGCTWRGPAAAIASAVPALAGFQRLCSSPISWHTGSTCDLLQRFHPGKTPAKTSRGTVPLPYEAEVTAAHQCLGLGRIRVPLGGADRKAFEAAGYGDVPRRTSKARCQQARQESEAGSHLQLGLEGVRLLRRQHVRVLVLRQREECEFECFPQPTNRPPRRLLIRLSDWCQAGMAGASLRAAHFCEASGTR